VSIEVECQRVGCGATADIFMETDWTTPTFAQQDPFADLHEEYGPTLSIALPLGWVVDSTEHGDVIHCPEHAA
jgi:hypothetical protein